VVSRIEVKEHANFCRIMGKTKYSEILVVLAVALVCVKNVETRFDK